MSAGSILITQGTQTGIPIDTVSGTTYPISKIDVGNLGSSVPWQGTVTVSVGTIATGSIRMTAGTVTGGTVNTVEFLSAGSLSMLQSGTIDALSQLPPGAFSTTINTAGTAFGTLKAGVGGSTIYITDLEINMGLVAGTVALYNGGTANVIGGTWSFNTNGGLVTNRRTPLFGSSGSAVCYQQQGTAALSITASGFVK